MSGERSDTNFWRSATEPLTADDEKGQTGPVDKLAPERRMVAVYVSGWVNGWNVKPSPEGSGSEALDPDRPDRFKCWSSLLAWAETQPELAAVPYGRLVRIFKEEMELWNL